MRSTLQPGPLPTLGVGLLLWVWFGVAWASVVSADSVVRVGIYENKPLIFQSAQGKVSGIYADILDHIAAREGWTLWYVPGTWKQSLRRLESGKIDLLVAIAYSKERAKRYDFTKETVISNWGAIYTRRGSGIRSILDLRHRKVIMLQGDIYAQGLQKLLRKFAIPCTLLYAQDYRGVFRSLSRGEADAGAVNRFFAAQHKKKYQVIKTSIVFTPREIRLAAKKGQKGALLRAIDGHLRRQQKDPGSVYHRTMERWLGFGEVRHIFPAWLRWAVGSGLGVVLLLVLLSFVLRTQVQAKTAALQHKNTELQQLIEERLQAERALQEAHDELEARVRQRTAALHNALGELQEQHQQLLTTQHQLIHSEKMASLATLVAGMAHEINNPSNFALVGAHNLQHRLSQFRAYLLELVEDDEEAVALFAEQFEPLFRNLDAVLEGTDRIKSIVRALSSFSQLATSERRRTHIAEVLQSAISALKLEVDDSLKLHLELEENPAFACWPTQLTMLFTEILRNAREAIAHKRQEGRQERGTLRIRTHLIEDTLAVEIVDDGVGMSQAHQAKIFEPFFTTREVGAGMGLGLSIAFGIAGMHGGKIEVSSRQGEGSLFTILLPLEAPEPENIPSRLSSPVQTPQASLPQ